MSKSRIVTSPPHRDRQLHAARRPNLTASLDLSRKKKHEVKHFSAVSVSILVQTSTDNATNPQKSPHQRRPRRRLRQLQGESNLHGRRHNPTHRPCQRKFPPTPSRTLLNANNSSQVACGFHAGDPLIMQETVRACKRNNIKVGAHPGLPDIQGFGRREIKMSPEELTAMVRYQVGALQGFLDAEGVPLHHVKPHGVLYGMMYRDEEVCRAVYEGVPKGVRVFGLAGLVPSIPRFHCLFGEAPSILMSI